MCCMMGHGMDHGDRVEKPAAEQGQQDSLIEILRRRYALGEITQEQLEKMKAVLGLSDGEAVGATAGSRNSWEAGHHT